MFSQYFQGNTSVLQRKYFSTAEEVLRYFLRSTGFDQRTVNSAFMVLKEKKIEAILVIEVASVSDESYTFNYFLKYLLYKPSKPFP